MSDGKTHDRVGLFIGIIFGCFAFFYGGLVIGSPFSFGWLLSLFIFSPDSDLMPKKRTGILAFFLYPYSLLFKHRGLSHSFFWGTISRIIYLIITFLIILFIFTKMGYVQVNFASLFDDVLIFMSHFSLKKPIYQILLAFYAGMFGADAIHIFMDIFSTLIKKLKKEVF
jgi:uncharacterized metal-binding protein